ncbi:16S rRNA (adenine(1518)-N(6)/adenine(1519)-N(6))-dimethyltransferase RsmA [Nodosilinea sp. P-1105]|uniref:16S rRNA (adenine(1518)-N(6)/adenine(1519)-N(6))- dimethyltransferase RsmA n=1 Tax=Nodosilinea sp. P-1105 TaxID=2546229 RepID=UPI00146C049A|nr:16S rRNA (adenine(1518)-N(6)/adenine(1519)-N(6))-dimethyltransferase RsmA [Nodosilinea sp. P-1105]NMF82968.1 16S rRNA (adenine(1518)-N(6)/adenine(1519)-N(6))-dimethyltransferase RsmA [Nodosilinea sp. P-1105]
MFSQRTRKRFGQHWLTSEKVLHAMLEAAAVTRQDCVLEIGAGTGVLTKWLMPLADAVVAVEIDWDLCRRLQNQFAQVDNFRLVQGDVLGLDLGAIAPAKDFPFGPPNKVVANIPYYITGPILETLLGSLATPNPNPYDTIVLLVQKEVAERLYAKPGTKAFGALSVRVQYLAACRLVCPVPAKAFRPPPKVDSAVVQLTPRPLATPAVDPEGLNQLVTLGFRSKRKMLRNNLKGICDRDSLTTLMTQLGIADTARAEDLSVDQWVALANQLGQGNKNLEES